MLGRAVSCEPMTATTPATPVFSIANEGATLFQPNTDTTSAFNIKSSTGNNAFTVDTANGRVGVGLQGSNVPVLDSQGLEIRERSSCLVVPRMTILL